MSVVGGQPKKTKQTNKLHPSYKAVWSHAYIDPMSDKLNLDYLKLFYCEVMNMSVVGGQPKKKTLNPSYKAIKHIKHIFLISYYY